MYFNYKQAVSKHTVNQRLDSHLLVDLVPKPSLQELPVHSVEKEVLASTLLSGLVSHHKLDQINKS